MGIFDAVLQVKSLGVEHAQRGDACTMMLPHSRVHSVLMGNKHRIWGADGEATMCGSQGRLKSQGKCSCT